MSIDQTLMTCQLLSSSQADSVGLKHKGKVGTSGVNVPIWGNGRCELVSVEEKIKEETSLGKRFSHSIHSQLLSAHCIPYILRTYTGGYCSPMLSWEDTRLDRTVLVLWEHPA